MKHLIFLVALMSALLGVVPVAASSSPNTSPNTSPHTTTAQAPSQLRREVFGFALASSLSDPTVGYTTWNFSLLSTVAFFGLHINDDGTIANDSGLTEWNSSGLTNLLSTAHSNGAKVVVTVIKQDFAPGTPAMCAALTNRATTVSQTVSEVTAKQVDGLNIDYEGLNGTCPNGQTARAMMTDFVGRLRAALPAGSYLSVDAYASSAADPLGFFDVPGLNAYVDSFFVMAYDLEYSNYRRTPTSCTSFCLGPTAPLSGYYYNDTTTASQYVNAVGPSKVILGVPYYGRKSCVGSVTPNAYPTGPVTADTYLNASTEASSPEVQAGSYVTHRDANDPSGQERWDAWYNTTLNCTRELYWDDTTSLGLKYDLVNRDGLRGVGIWNLNYGGGAPELWNLIASHFVGCTNAAVSTNPTTPQAVGTQVQLNASSGNCPNPRYEFWLLPPGGKWNVAQHYSSLATYSWNTAGRPAGTYRFSVWARDVSSSSSYDTFNAFDYVLTTSPCTAMTAPATPPSAVVGMTVTVTGAATGCPNPSYEFWLLPPGGTWILVQPYSSSATLTWSTTGKPAGSYRFSVWARDATSTASYDAFSAFQYALTLPNCSAMTATASPATSANVATQVTVTGSATGCPNPLYEFWLLPPGGTWTLVQPYSSGATFTWSTTGKPAGSYRFSVWAREVGSSASYDAFSAFQYTLAVAPPCTGMIATASPAASAASGTTVTIAGAATGCPNPQYEFWLLPPGGTWTLVQPYSSSATLTWSTTAKPAGSYRFSVWARDATSTASYDAFSAFQYALTLPNCSPMTATASPATSASVGTQVTVTGSATGCPNPLYEFWLLPPGGTWTLVQPYSSSAAFTWNTTGKPAGTYRFSVWARDAGSSSSYDAFSAFNYPLT